MQLVGAINLVNVCLNSHVNLFSSNARETIYLYHISVSFYMTSDAHNKHSMKLIY